MFVAVMALAASATLADDKKPEPALDGYCPAAYVLHGKAMKGDKAHQWSFQGELYYLSNAEALAKFKADAEKYAPQFAGWCTTALAGFGNKFKGDPLQFDVRDGKVYLFSRNERIPDRAKRHYLTQPDKTITAARARWLVPEIEGWCPAAYLYAGKAIKGDSKYTAVYKGSLYHMSSPEAQAAFMKDPAKYFPQYDGHCTGLLAEGQVYNHPDPAQFSVVDGKVYLFFDAKRKAAFDADPKGTIKKANEQWAKPRDE